MYLGRMYGEHVTRALFVGRAHIDSIVIGWLVDTLKSTTCWSRSLYTCDKNSHLC